jgi:hypothetical protein
MAVGSAGNTAAPPHPRSPTTVHSSNRGEHAPGGCLGDLYGGPGLMPKGPGGEKRPADVIGGAMKVMRIETCEEADEREPVASAASQLGKELLGRGTCHLRSPRRRRRGGGKIRIDMFIFLSSYEAAKMNMGFDDRHLF